MPRTTIPSYQLERARTELAAAILNLQPYDCGIRASSGDLECNAMYIEELCSLVARHVQAVMTDAKDSVGISSIAPSDALGILDAAKDLAAQLNAAASIVDEAEDFRFAQMKRRLAGVA